MVGITAELPGITRGAIKRVALDHLLEVAGKIDPILTGASPSFFLRNSRSRLLSCRFTSGR